MSSAEYKPDEKASRLDEIRQRLLVAGVRRVYSECLDDLAALAAVYAPALSLLLEQIVEHDLAEVSVRSIFFDDSMVDDAVQETVLAVAAGISGFRGESSFLTWLDRVARNAAKQTLRLGVPKSAEIVRDKDAWATRMSSEAVDRQVLETAMAELTDDHREVLILREVEALSYEELSARLGVPLNTVRTRLRRARQRLTVVLVAIQMER